MFSPPLPCPPSLPHSPSRVQNAVCEGEQTGSGDRGGTAAAAAAAAQEVESAAATDRGEGHSAAPAAKAKETEDRSVAVPVPRAGRTTGRGSSVQAHPAPVAAGATAPGAGDPAPGPACGPAPRELPRRVEPARVCRELEEKVAVVDATEAGDGGGWFLPIGAAAERTGEPNHHPACSPRASLTQVKLRGNAGPKPLQKLAIRVRIFVFFFALTYIRPSFPGILDGDLSGIPVATAGRGALPLKERGAVSHRLSPIFISGRYVSRLFERVWGGGGVPAKKAVRSCYVCVYEINERLSCLVDLHTCKRGELTYLIRLMLVLVWWWC